MCLPWRSWRNRKTLKVNFGPKLAISAVRDSQPQVKIIGLDTDINDNDLILNFKEQNHWLRNTNISVAERFQVPTSKGRYTNVILNCDLPALKKLIEKGSVICGFEEKRVYEYVSIIQCFNCQRFGYVASAWNSLPQCKFCSLPHASNSCEDKEVIKCANCSRANKKGAGWKVSNALRPNSRVKKVPFK